MSKDQQNPLGNPLSRRHLLGLMAGSAAGLALATACGQAPTPASTGGQAPAPQSGGKVFHGAWPYQIPPAGHWNPFAPNVIDLGAYMNLVSMPMAIYYWADAKWMPLLATEWKMVPPDRFEVTLRQGVKWADGSEVTAQDYVTTFTIGRLLDSTIWMFIDGVQGEGNKLSFHMKQPSTVVERYVLKQTAADHATYGVWASKVEDLVKAGKTKDDDEWKAVRKDLEAFRPKGPAANGPFQIDQGSITEAQLTLHKVPTAFNASATKFDQIVIYNGETPQITPLVLAKNVDYATHAFPPATEKAFEEVGVRIVRPPTYSGPALYFNYAALKAIAPKEVRQAIAHAINREENGTVSLGASGVGVKQMTGFSDNIVPLWLAEADQAKLDQYPYDLQKAEALMKQVGYTKGADGVWVSKDGERMEYDLSVPTEYSDWSASATNLAEQLNKFGMKVTVRTVTQAQQPIEVNDGKFQLAIQSWGAGNPHPHFSLKGDLFTHNISTKVGGMKFPMKQQTSQGDVDLQDLVVQAGAGLDEAAQKGAVTKVALAFNELLPIIPLWERYGNNAVLDNVRVSGWPADGDPIYRNAPYSDPFVVLMMLDGRLKPV